MMRTFDVGLQSSCQGHASRRVHGYKPGAGSSGRLRGAARRSKPAPSAARVQSSAIRALNEHQQDATRPGLDAETPASTAPAWGTTVAAATEKASELWYSVLKRVLRQDWRVGYLLVTFLSRTTLVLAHLMATVAEAAQKARLELNTNLPSVAAALNLPSSAADSASEPAEARSAVPVDTTGLAQLLVSLGLTAEDAAAITTQRTMDAPEDTALSTLLQEGKVPDATSAWRIMQPATTVDPAPTPTPAADLSADPVAEDADTPMYSNVLDEFMNNQIYSLFDLAPAGTASGLGGGGGRGGNGRGGASGDAAGGDDDGAGLHLSLAQRVLLLRLLRAALAMCIIAPPAACVYTAAMLLGMLLAWCRTRVVEPQPAAQPMPARLMDKVAGPVIKYEDWGSRDLRQPRVQQPWETQHPITQRVSKVAYNRALNRLNHLFLQVQHLELLLSQERATNQHLKTVVVQQVVRKLQEQDLAVRQAQAEVAHYAAKAVVANAVQSTLVRAIESERDVVRMQQTQLKSQLPQLTSASDSLGEPSGVAVVTLVASDHCQQHAALRREVQTLRLQLLEMGQRIESQALQLAAAAELTSQLQASGRERRQLQKLLGQEQATSAKLMTHTTTLQSDLDAITGSFQKLQGSYEKLEEDYEKLHSEYQEIMRLFDQEVELVGEYRKEVEQQDSDLAVQRQGAKRLRALLQAAVDERMKLERQLQQQAEACKQLQGQLTEAAADEEQLRQRLDASQVDCAGLRDQLAAAASDRQQLVQQLLAATRERDQLLQQVEMKLATTSQDAEAQTAATLGAVATTIVSFPGTVYGLDMPDTASGQLPGAVDAAARDICEQAPATDVLGAVTSPGIVSWEASEGDSVPTLSAEESSVGLSPQTSALMNPSGLGEAIFVPLHPRKDTVSSDGASDAMSDGMEYEPDTHTHSIAQLPTMGSNRPSRIPSAPGAPSTAAPSVQEHLGISPRLPCPPAPSVVAPTGTRKRWQVAPMPDSASVNACSSNGATCHVNVNSKLVAADQKPDSLGQRMSRGLNKLTRQLSNKVSHAEDAEMA